MKVRVEAGVLKVDYLVSKRIPNNKCVIMTTNNTFLSTALCGQAIPANRTCAMVLEQAEQLISMENVLMNRD